MVKATVRYFNGNYIDCIRTVSNYLAKENIKITDTKSEFAGIYSADTFTKVTIELDDYTQLSKLILDLNYELQGINDKWYIEVWRSEEVFSITKDNFFKRLLRKFRKEKQNENSTVQS